MQLSSAIAIPKQWPISWQKPAWISRPTYLLFFADSAGLILSGLLLFLILLPESNQTTWIRYSGAILIAWIAFATYSFASKFYDWRHFAEQVARTTKAFAAILVAFGTLLLIGFILKWTEHYSRLWVGSWLLLFTFYVLASRVVLTWYLTRSRQGQILHRRAVIVGAGSQGQKVYQQLNSVKGHGIDIVGFIDDRETRHATHRAPDAPLLGDTDIIQSLVADQSIDLVIIALPRTAVARIHQLVHKLSHWAVDIYMAPDHIELNYADRPMYRIGGMHVLSLKDRPISDWSALLKRAEDLAIAIPIVIVLLPLLGLIALAIKLESNGPVLFVQERLGFNNNLIKVYKFRSMYVEQTDAHADQQTQRHDPRVTRVGRWIRRTSLDELPQLFNVIQGSMSVVGPRPHALNTKAGGLLFQEAVDAYASRHRVKPGITGWAQCNGWRGETDHVHKLVKRVEHDLYYIDHWSLILDLLVLLKTAKILLSQQQNAY